MTIGEFVATGCGQSKKKAKHCAAKAILDKLLGAQNAGMATPGQPTIPDLAQAVQHLKRIRLFAANYPTSIEYANQHQESNLKLMLKQEFWFLI